MNNPSYQELVQKILTREGLLKLRSSIDRYLDFECALRRAVMVLFIYHDDKKDRLKSNNTNDFSGNICFKVSEWKKIIGAEMSAIFGKNYREITLIEILNSLAGISNLSSTIWELEKTFNLSSDSPDRSFLFVPFSVSERTINSDFNALSDGEEIPPWLTASKEGNTNYYRWLDLAQLPIFAEDRALTVPDGITIDRKAAKMLGDYLEILTFIEPELAYIVNLLSDEPNLDRRVHLHLDYVVPEDHPLDIIVDDCHEFLREVWAKEIVTPISYKYRSAKKQEISYVVYPVCIYYFQRAKYLFAWGCEADREVQWYNHRIDRIQANSLQVIPWDSDAVPNAIEQDRQLDRLPTPAKIEHEMKKVAWGFEFYKEPVTLILRFDREYHDSFIVNTFRHHTFQLIPNLDDVKRLITNEAADPELLARIDLHPQDAYFQVQVRLHDINIIMRLRAWGDKVEVLSPNVIRQRMITDLQNTLDAYQK
jgi:CRISPR-associated protein (TIGR03985 family)